MAVLSDTKGGNCNVPSKRKGNVPSVDYDYYRHLIETASNSVNALDFLQNRIIPVRYVCTQHFFRCLDTLSQRSYVTQVKTQLPCTIPGSDFSTLENRVSNTFTKTNGLACRFEKAPSLSAVEKRANENWLNL